MTTKPQETQQLLVNEINIKKKPDEEYASEVHKGTVTLANAQQVIQLVITIASVVGVLVTLYLTTKLAPIYQDNALIQQRVEAQSRRIDELKDDTNQIKLDTNQIKTDLAEIKGFIRGNKTN